MTTITPHTDAARKALEAIEAYIEEAVKRGTVSSIDGTFQKHICGVCAMLSAEALDRCYGPEEIVTSFARAIACGVSNVIATLASAPALDTETVQRWYDTEYALSVAQLASGAINKDYDFFECCENVERPKGSRA